MKFCIRLLQGFCGITAMVGFTYAQSADVNLPKQRDAMVISAESLLTKKRTSIPSGPSMVDPFTGIVPPSEPEESVSAQGMPVVSVSNAELAASLAAQINATGTLVFGEKRFLLSGQKRFKVGDVIKINFNDTDYDVALAGVTATTFTVKYKDTSHTRAVKLSK